ncbi:MAG: hypothetical protein SP4CHLAM5_01190 [Chlamydiia bacterium]|nr:hypothetical protein [Chlamydiia bacterium]MCH9617995.1 hypothetical protein [Chlamydiia bacterium]MCH9623680.1 hypothetical protein [Chlamydiia bacterium]
MINLLGTTAPNAVSEQSLSPSFMGRSLQIITRTLPLTLLVLAVLVVVIKIYYRCANYDKELRSNSDKLLKHTEKQIQDAKKQQEKYVSDYQKAQNKKSQEARNQANARLKELQQRQQRQRQQQEKPVRAESKPRVRKQVTRDLPPLENYQRRVALQRDQIDIVASEWLANRERQIKKQNKANQSALEALKKL